MTAMMHAVGYRKPAPISDPASLEDAEVPVPEPGPRDLLVEVKAVSVNPVDVKLRASSDPGGELKILGYDAAGIVTAVGDKVTLFSPGDEVYYAGSVARPGTNAQFHVVDERIVGHKPRMLTFVEAAALPLTTITAWETLFDRFRLSPESSGTLLALAAAGGVGSMITQLARALTRVTVIGTASARVPAVGARPWRPSGGEPPRPGERGARGRTRRRDLHLFPAHWGHDRQFRRDPAAVRRGHGDRQRNG